MVLYRKLAFNKNWNGKWNGVSEAAYSPTHVEQVCCTSWSCLPANESTCKTLSLVQGGMWSQALLIKLSESWKNPFYMWQGLKTALRRSSSLFQREASRILIAWILRRTICGELLSESYLQLAIKHCLMQVWSLGFLFVAFILPWYFLSLTLHLLFILSFHALISSLLNIISYQLRCKSGQDLYFQFNKTSENDLLNQCKKNTGGEF